jgi:hypothetical protein
MWQCKASELLWDCTVPLWFTTTIVITKLLLVLLAIWWRPGPALLLGGIEAMPIRVVGTVAKSPQAFHSRSGKPTCLRACSPPVYAGG